MKLRYLVYFLIYPVFGPLIGFACIEILGSFYVAAEFGIQSIISDRSPKGGSVNFVLQISYLIGGFPAVATGFYAASALARQGCSKLRVALRVSIISSLVVGLLLYLVLPSDEHIVAGTIVLAVFSVI
ncbi:MAG: hypothetical protein AB8B94_16655, partial [Hyphomicrobiales bacterium]